MFRDKEIKICKCLQLNYHNYNENITEDKTVSTHQLRSKL